MAQVVDSTNIDQFMTTGKVDEFKPPAASAEPPPVESTKEPEQVESAAKAEDDGDDKGDDSLPEHARKVIGKKHRAMKEAEEFAEREYTQRRAAEKRADELERRLVEQDQKSRPAPVEAVEPKQDDFTTVQDYIEALADFKVEQKLEKKQREAEQQRITDEAMKVRDTFAKRITQAMKDIPDFEAVTSAVDIELPAHITQHILESDVGPILGYHLSKYPDELNRILKLSPIRAIAELGKLEATLDKKPADKPVGNTPERAVSKAPPPITPIEGKSVPINPNLNRDMPYSEYKALKAAQAKKR